ncbi:telomere-capping, CST complex subunit-domain-containing protein [Chlamydoabsidia padenii]|nr:telomere-capping, CST complex subunit-domain-containing protein [Chlamydoabsidia padenii]
MSTVPSGKPVLLQDLVTNAQQYTNTSIRVTGMLRYYDPIQNSATMEYKQASLRLNTELVDVHAPIDAMIQCIGEVDYDEGLDQLVLKPRILRKVETMDMEIYEKSVSLLNQYLQTT